MPEWLDVIGSLSSNFGRAEPLEIPRPSPAFVSSEQLELWRCDYASLWWLAQQHTKRLRMLLTDECACAVATETGVVLHVDGSSHLTAPRQWRAGARLFSDRAVQERVRRGGILVIGDRELVDMVVPIMGTDGAPIALLGVAYEGTPSPAEMAAPIYAADCIGTAVELAQLQRDYEITIGTVGHELRQPLSALVTAMDLMGRTPQTVAQRPFQVAQRQTRQIGSLVESLIDMSRLMTGKLRPLRKLMDVRTAIRGAAEDVRFDVSAKGHQVTIDIPSHAVWCVGEAGRLQQVVRNLLLNAIRYTPAPGRIDLVAKDQHGIITIEVTDNGSGFDPQDRDRIFRPFVQQRGSAAQGLGLGLAISRGIVQALRGSLVAESAGRARGSKFIVTLPGVTERTRELRDVVDKTRAEAQIVVKRAQTLRDAIGSSSWRVAGRERFG